MCFNISPNSKHYFVYNYTNDYRPSELLEIDKVRNEKVISTYKIFMFKVDDVGMKNFKPNDEVVDMKVCTFDEVDNVWELTRFIYEYIQ